ncbi:hypothetical protein [Deinococcus sp. QL22]|uniref:hypothetical protein n=1 Tax=Deinococcus sp. QL22 TaxID=2939437 RepID=UPI00201806FF|nr:hypothetical protein [Deinococcus sp. QL22]UQN10658.1 hypothetical protein M1R55_30245 [Deinococcus sp. QL22]
MTSAMETVLSKLGGGMNTPPSLLSYLLKLNPQNAVKPSSTRFDQPLDPVGNQGGAG